MIDFDIEKSAYNRNWYSDIQKRKIKLACTRTHNSSLNTVNIYNFIPNGEDVILSF